MNFVLVPALAYHFCLNLPAAFTQPRARLLVVESCRVFATFLALVNCDLSEVGISLRLDWMAIHDRDQVHPMQPPISMAMPSEAGRGSTTSGQHISLLNELLVNLEYYNLGD